MRVKIEQNEHGENYFLIPEELQKELLWNEGYTIQWIDNSDGSWTLKKLSKLEALKLKGFEDPKVKAEYDGIENCPSDELRREESELQECRMPSLLKKRSSKKLLPHCDSVLEFIHILSMLVYPTKSYPIDKC